MNIVKINLELFLARVKVRQQVNQTNQRKYENYRPRTFRPSAIQQA